MAETSTALPTPTCPYCGSMPHAYWAHCPRIYAITYFDDSYKSVQRVEFYEPHPTTSDALAEAMAVMTTVVARSQPGDRTFDDLMRDMDWLADAARAWLDKWGKR